MDDVVTPEHRQDAHHLIQMMAAYQEAEDLINIGAYVNGSNERIDQAIKMMDQIRAYLVQASDEETDFKSTCERLRALIAA